MSDREQYLLEKLSERGQLTIEDAQAFEIEYQELLAAKQRAIDIDAKVNAEPVPFSVLGIDLNGMPVEFVELVEGVYRSTLKSCLNEHAIELEQLEQKIEAREATLREYEAANQDLRTQNNSLQAYANSRADELAGTINRQYELTAELADANSKRDAAVRDSEEWLKQLSQSQHTIAELQGEIADYRQAEEYRQRQEQPLMVTDEESNALQAKADAVKKLFTKSENWGSVEKLYKPDGTYEVVPRAELADWESVDVPSVESFEVINPTFPEVQNEQPIDGMDEYATERQDVPDDRSWTVEETFEQEVYRRLSYLEASVSALEIFGVGKVEAA